MRSPRACGSVASQWRNDMKVVKTGNGPQTGDRPQTEQGREPGSVPKRTDDLRISAVRALIPPQLLLEELPTYAHSLATVPNARQAVHRVLPAADNRPVAALG